MVPFCLDQTYRNGMVIDEVIQVPPSLFISGRRSIIGWASGTSIDSQDTLSFSVLSGVRSMMSGKVRFRAVLTTTGHQK
jgi:D-arabinose 1-dehydrogenase-like Zn-dependent alcohol dehydrogenase